MKLFDVTNSKALQENFQGNKYVRTYTMKHFNHLFVKTSYIYILHMFYIYAFYINLEHHFFKIILL